MAKSIFVDPSKLEDVASKIENQAADYKKVYNRLFSEVEGMASAWQGPDNLAFTNQIKGFMNDFQNMSKILNQYSEFLKLCAKNYKETQNEVISNAKKLNN